MSTKKRKQRQVKGGYINLNDVIIEPGDSYKNWIFYAKSKLKERETKLMEIRINKLKQTILKNIQIFESDNQYNNNNNNIIVSKNDISEYIDNKLNDYDHLMESTMSGLSELLTNWNGVQIDKKKTNPSSFREYFYDSRNWFDQRKKKITAKHFWMNILCIIQEFVLKAATNFIDNQYPEIQYKFHNHLLRQIMLGILTENICFAATKPRPLFPSGMIKDIKCIKQLMSDLFGEDLNVNEIVREQKKLSATKIRSVIIKRLQEILKNAKNEFNDVMNAHYDQQQLVSHASVYCAECKQCKQQQLIPSMIPLQYLCNACAEYQECEQCKEEKIQQPLQLITSDNINNDNNNNNIVSDIEYNRSLSTLPSAQDFRYRPY